MSGRLKGPREQSAWWNVYFEASSRKVPPRLLEENPYRSGWRLCVPKTLSELMLLESPKLVE
jgi:hypothetical protein